MLPASSTAATYALSHEADIAKVQEWLGQQDLIERFVYFDNVIDVGDLYPPFKGLRFRGRLDELYQVTINRDWHP
jgi:hypothetical protein